MRFLQLVVASGNPTPQSPEQRARAGQAIRAAIASGQTLATGPLGKRAVAAARIVKKDGEITVDESPTGDGWMSSGGYSLSEFPSKEAAIAYAKQTLDMMGDATAELIQVGEMHPAPGRALGPLPSGVIPYLTVDGASEVSAFYQRAFAAREVRRMPSEDGKRLMHCHLEINGGALMLSDNFPEYGHPAVARSTSYTMQLVVADGQVWWSRAIEAGCTEKLPFEVAPWGDRYGQLVDPFGVTWAISSPVT